MLIPAIVAFVRNSNLIAGIERASTVDEVSATKCFLELPTLLLMDVCALQAVYAPDEPIRERVGMNVTIELTKLCMRVSRAPSPPYDNPWLEHITFENLHPFPEGNGRTGRAIWAWHMQKIGVDPFALPFLQRFYYQTIENS